MPNADAKDDVAAVVINYNTAGLTRRCVASLLAAGIPRVVVLDNASGAEDYARLRDAHAGESRVKLMRSDTNLGFAAGSNAAIGEALRDPACALVLSFNSDAIADAAGLDACVRAMRQGGYDLMGGRMHKASPGPAGQMVDSLGIALYRSLLASNRQSTEDGYLGPTGGFAFYSRRFLEEVRTAHGYVFDPTYFCYAEDTDLCVRARLLGFAVGYTDAVAAHHEGQASSTGEYNDFILYHGIRNSIWMMAKSIPGWIIVAHLPWVLALHVGIVLRHARQHRWRTLLRLYGDALRGMPRVLRERSRVQATRRVSLRAFHAHIDRHFYEKSFVRGAWRDLFGRS
jgi:GT2 family glycosyltransferase